MSAETEDVLLERQIEKILRSIHINGTMKGLRYLTYAIAETVRDPARTNLITKDLYWEIAHVYKTTASCVERDMRWAICISWECAKKKLDQIAPCHLVKRPTNKQFIDLVAFYIRMQ